MKHTSPQPVAGPPLTLLSVVIPARNEEGCIVSTIEHLHLELKLREVPHEIVVVDDGSTDRTWALLQQLASRTQEVQAVQNNGDHGFGRAVVCGLDHAKGDAIAVMMADESDDCRDVVRYWKKLNEGYDCVFGSRFVKEGGVIDYPWLKYYLNRAANLFIKLIFRIPLNDTTNAFKAYRKTAIDGCRPLIAPHFNLTVEMPLKAIVRGYSWAVIPITWRNRRSGVAKLKIKEMGSRYFFICMYIWLEKYFSGGGLPQALDGCGACSFLKFSSPEINGPAPNCQPRITRHAFIDRIEKQFQICRPPGRFGACGVRAGNLFFCPRFVLWRGLGMDVAEAYRNPEVNRAVDVLKQLDDPFVKIEDQSNEVIRWRLLFPLIGHYLHLPIWLYMAIPHIGCVIALAFIAHLILKERRDLMWAFMAATLVATCSWFFAATGWLTYADSWFLLGLLIVGFSPSRIAIAAACLLVPFIDERFIIALPLAFMVRVIYLGLNDPEKRRDLLLDGVALGAPSMPYILIRLVLLLSADSTSQHYIDYHMKELQDANVSWFRYVEGIWMGLRGAWVLVIALVWICYQRRRWVTFGLLSAALLLTLILGLVIAADIGRSMSSFVPAAALGLVLLIRERPNWLQCGLPALLAVNLLLPASHVITLFKVPILYLYAEVDHYRNPPSYLDPNMYIENAKAMLAQKQFPQADAMLDRAIRLESQNSTAFVLRAFTHLYAGDLNGAIDYADSAISIDPTSPNALYCKALIYRQSGDLASMKRLLTEALNRSDPNWPSRNDALGFLNNPYMGMVPTTSSTQPADTGGTELHL